MIEIPQDPTPPRTCQLMVEEGAERACDNGRAVDNNRDRLSSIGTRNRDVQEQSHSRDAEGKRHGENGMIDADRPVSSLRESQSYHILARFIRLNRSRRYDRSS